MGIYLGAKELGGGGGAIIGTIAPLHVGGFDTHVDEYDGTWLRTGIAASPTDFPSAAGNYLVDGRSLATSYNGNYARQLNLPHFYATVNPYEDLSLHSYQKSEIIAAVEDRTLSTAFTQSSFRSKGNSTTGMRNNCRLVSAAYNSSLEITVYNDGTGSGDYYKVNSVTRAFKDVGGTKFFFGVRALPTVTTDPFSTTEPVTNSDILASNFNFDSTDVANSIIDLAAHPTDGSFYALVSSSVNYNARVGDNNAWIVKFSMSSSGVASNFSIVSGNKIPEFSTLTTAAVTAIGVYLGKLIVFGTPNMTTNNSPSASSSCILEYDLSTGAYLSAYVPDISPTIENASFDWKKDKGLWISDDYIMILGDYSIDRGMTSYSKIVGGSNELFLQEDGSLSTTPSTRPIYTKVS
jgi:hypothetical protein